MLPGSRTLNSKDEVAALTIIQVQQNFDFIDA